MKVVIAPSAGKTNPYQQLLISALQNNGVKVLLSTGFMFPWTSMLKHGLPQVIHLQWQHVYFRSKWLPEAMLRTTVFMLQAVVLRLLGVRFVWTVHNLVNHERHHVGWELFACRLLARLVDSIIVHCGAVRALVSSTYRVTPTKLCVVPHGHYIGWYPQPVQRQEARAQLGLPACGKIFLFFGQVRTYKGLDQLLSQFSQVAADDVLLIVAGEPRPQSLKQQLLTQVSADPRVMTEFKFVDDVRLVTLICACDLVVLPYRDSLTSGAAVLSASYGRPVLMPRLGCMEEFPQGSAILYEAHDPQNLRRALEQALTAPLEEMGRLARAHVEQFPWSAVGERTFNLYRSLSTRDRAGVG